MRHPVWYRVLLAVWGLWFTAAMSEVGGLASCPMHGNHAAHVGAHAAAAGKAQATSSHLAHAAERGTAHQPSAPQKGAVCTCLGQACCAPLVVGPTAAVQLPRALTVVVAVAAYRETAVVSVQRGYEHPFANGPPRVASL